MRSLERRSSAFLTAWLEQQLDDQRPFALIRFPGKQDLCCLTEPENKPEITDTAFVFAPYKREAPMLKLHAPTGFKVDTSALVMPRPCKSTRLNVQGNAKENYINKIAQVQKAIKQGEVTKVVLSRSIQIPVERDPWHLYLRILLRHKNACCYWWFHPDSGHWMGATPELLLETVKDKVQVMSLAGTLAADAGQEAAWTTKEQEEQALVTRYIEKILEDYGGRVNQTGPTTVQAGNMIHLRTLLETTNAGNLNSLISQLHPTPAVCGLPVEDASRMIARLEPHNREYYTGYFGLLAGRPVRKAQLYVNLRCMKWNPSEITVFVGGGITAESDPEKEWQETVAKSNTMLDALDITPY